jgi:hypothetical protein
MLAQNSNFDYIRQACLAAMSIRATNENAKICLVTNDPVPTKYKQVFDDIVDIPWGDHAKDEDWKVSNRWKLYHSIPYDETAVIDTDMLVLDDLSTWFKFLDNYDLFYTSSVITYRGETVPKDSHYRKTFYNFNLPNLYNGFHYFKKSDTAHEFNDWLELITNNWQQFYMQVNNSLKHLPHPSMDITAAIACKIMDNEHLITNKKAKYPNFVHMKPKVQNWVDNFSYRWQDRVGVYLDNNLQLKIGNYRQNGIFHYTEKDFVTSNIVKKYENYLGI